MSEGSAIRPASRTEAKPLIGLYSESGCGKTWSALLLARGFVGASGSICMIETEGGRGEAFVGRAPVGDYLVRPIRGDFSPQEYGKAITEAERANVNALIIDSASHEWEGAGGVLAMAAKNQADGKKGVLVWQQPKIDHQRHFMLRLMQTSIPLVIVCMRAKYPMEQVKGEWARSRTLEPKQADDILFEMLVHGWIDAEHKLHVTKYTLPDLADAIRDGEPISIESGERLGAWAKGSTASTGSTASPPSPRGKPKQDGTGAPPDWQDYVERWDVILDEAVSADALGTTWNSDVHKRLRRGIVWPERGTFVPDPLDDLTARVARKISDLKTKVSA